MAQEIRMLQGGDFVPVIADFTSALTMDGTAQTVALHQLCGRVLVTNRGITGQTLRIAFGTDAADAIANLAVSGGAASKGAFLGAGVDGFPPVALLGVPEWATYVAVCSGNVGANQGVVVEQGF